MPPQADNPEGFWEHLGFVALNDELLNALGGAWDLPPQADENFKHPRLDPLRLKARLLIERFDPSSIWGWKDPRNSVTLPFWQEVLPGLKTFIIVRNPLEVAHSMRTRNGTSYSFGLRLWEIYNRRLVDTASENDRLVTHYDSFFENAESELRRIARFAGLPDTEARIAAALVSARRRHIHFTIDELIDARVSTEVIELYRCLIAEAAPGRRKKTQVTKASSGDRAKSEEIELLPGAISRLNAFVPERIAQIEHLYGELLAQTEARHKTEIKHLTAHLAQTEAQHKAQVETLKAHLTQAHLTQAEALHKTDVEQFNAHLAKVEGRHKSQVEELVTHYNGEIEQLNARIKDMNGLLREDEDTSGG